MTADSKPLSQKLWSTLVALSRFQSATVYDIAGALFNERYGITASRAGGRLQSLKRMGYATNNERAWSITETGRTALQGDKP